MPAARGAPSASPLIRSRTQPPGDWFDSANLCSRWKPANQARGSVTADCRTPTAKANRRSAPYGFGENDTHHPARDRPAEVAASATRSANEQTEEVMPAASLRRLYALASSVRGGELRGDVSSSDAIARRGVGSMGRSGFHKVVRNGLKINQSPRFGGFTEFPYLTSLLPHRHLSSRLF